MELLISRIKNYFGNFGFKTALLHVTKIKTAIIQCLKWLVYERNFKLIALIALVMFMIWKVLEKKKIPDI
jgi:hypothetical protein